MEKLLAKTIETKEKLELEVLSLKQNIDLPEEKCEKLEKHVFSFENIVNILYWVSKWSDDDGSVWIFRSRCQWKKMLNTGCQAKKIPKRLQLVTQLSKEGQGLCHF